jgi:hypothetical protein
MANSPYKNEEKMLKVLNAWRTLAPAKKFAGMTAAEFEAQIDKSLAPRQRLIAINDEVKQEIATRETEDATTMTNVEMIVAGVVADPTEGANSALYGAMGYIRKEDRKSGLTRKVKNASTNGSK